MFSCDGADFAGCESEVIRLFESFKVVSSPEGKKDLKDLR